MRKVAIGLAFAALAALIVVGVALPFVAPPLVKRLAEAKLAEFGFPSRVSMKLGYGWRRGPELNGSLRLAVVGGPWEVRANFGAGLGEWRAAVQMPETEFSEADPTVARLLERYPVTAVSNLVFSGRIALNAKVERTRRLPVPVWSAKIPIRDVDARLTVDDKNVAIGGFGVTPGASGIADHVDVTPMLPRAREIVFDGLTLTNFFATVRMTEKALLVTEASAGFCGGKINLYSAFLDSKMLNAGLTLFMDDVDAGEALTRLKCFSGEATGRLHGKVKLFIRKGGKSIHLGDTFLYSTPGEGGKLKMRNPEAVTDELALAGIDDATRQNVANALTDLDYTVLKLDLRRGDGKQATLSVRIDGSATRGGLTVPVNLNVNINGELEQLINTGLGYSDKLKKGTRP